MPIKQSHDELPKANPSEGWVPDPDPWVGRALAEAWLALNYEAEKRHAVDGTLFRFSMAGYCTRAIAYYMAGVPESNPPDAANAWRMGLGTMVHDSLEDVIVKVFPGAEVEVRIDGRPDIDGSGHADIVVRDPNRISERTDKPWTTAIEVKTINGYGYKMQATTFRGPPAGPRNDHCAQGALAGMFLDADEVIVAYLSLENVSEDLVRYTNDPVFGKFTAQWTMDRETFLPYAERELKRVKFVTDRLDQSTPEAMVESADAMPRLIDNDDRQTVRINDPKTGAWTRLVDGKPVDAGKAWQCGYCRFRDTCVASQKGAE